MRCIHADMPDEKSGWQTLTRNAVVICALSVFAHVPMRTLCLQASAASTASSPVTRYTVDVLHALPHHPQNFTQGLVYHEGMLYESTGLYGHSSLQKIDARTGEALRVLPVANVFAEGLARWDNRLIQLTWQEQIAFIYALADFSVAGMFRYHTEGWGLTADAQSLIMSDGTAFLTFRHPHTFEIERTLRVTLDGRPLRFLNELEYIHGLIYANVWHETFIAQIDPHNGHVVGIIDASPLLTLLPRLDSESVLNGIAYNDQAQTLYLTGKNWPTIFEVNLIKTPGR